MSMDDWTGFLAYFISFPTILSHLYAYSSYILPLNSHE